MKLLTKKPTRSRKNGPSYRDVREILAAVGGGERVARELGITRQGVSVWVLRNEVPLAKIASLCRFLKREKIEINACMLHPDLAELKKFLCAA